MERKQERREEIEEPMRVGALGSKVKQYRDTQATNVIASSLAKKARSTSTVDSNRAYSNGESRENKYDDGVP